DVPDDFKDQCCSRRIQSWHYPIADCTTVWAIPGRCKESTSEQYVEVNILGARSKEQLTLNQRVQGSSPCAPTIDFSKFLHLFHENIPEGFEGQFEKSVPFSSLAIALSASAASRCR